MQEAESRDGGWRELFWKWLPHAAGRGGSSSTALQLEAGSSAGVGSSSGGGAGVWWSPVLDRVSYSVPAAPWGGFLAEEVSGCPTHFQSIEVLGSRVQLMAFG